MKLSIRAICLTGLFAAVISVLSILTIPTPWGVPFTLQTFAVALAGYVLGARCGTIATALYVLLGFCGVPVYAGMKAGPAVLFGPTGGYLYGFLFMALLCGMGMSAEGTVRGKRMRLVILSLLGLIVCHTPGIIQFRLVMNHMSGENVYTLFSAAMVASVPYLFKDILSVAGAWLVALAVRRALKSTGIPDLQARAS
ncbi:MAG: biotin transporter BioY [Muribaculaceae bacterium]|nr:biotin transporter BioY [Roseburia sp.]MCM1430330.1 biotin transporter BioY [Muribaculaceae bacterium]MCM1492474.1 biotin transporter BioY [Muribaculaceae bacterium]